MRVDISCFGQFSLGGAFGVDTEETLDVASGTGLIFESIADERERLVVVALQNCRRNYVLGIGEFDAVDHDHEILARGTFFCGSVHDRKFLSDNKIFAILNSNLRQKGVHPSLSSYQGLDCRTKLVSSSLPQSKPLC